MSTVVRIVIHDRRRLVRDGLASLLSEYDDMMVVGTAGDAEALAELCRREPVGVIVAGLGDGASGHAPAIASGRVGVPIVVLDDEFPVANVLDAIRAGGRNAPLSSDGETGAVPADEPSSPTIHLTSREREIVRCLAEGLPTKDIAVRLGVSAKTIDNHKQRLFTKLGVQSQAHAVVLSLRAGLLDDGHTEGR